MSEYVVYIILSVVFAVMCTACLCENDDDDNNMFTSNDGIEPQITDEESQEGDSDIMIADDYIGLEVDDDGLKVDDDRFSEFYGDRDNIRGYGEI
jgi:hypothetical protein